MQNDSIILNMLEELFEAVDSDIAKQLFDDEYCEDPDIAEETRDRLVEIVRRYQ